jgi:hypothetical protein
MASYTLSQVRKASDAEIAVMFEHLYDTKEYAEWLRPLSKSEVFNEAVCIKNWADKLTPKQISNYKRLAVYLDCLPSDYECFDMSEYLEIQYDPTTLITANLEIFNNALNDENDTTLHEYSSKWECQTVGCALGHAIDAGCFDPKDGNNDLTWGGLEKQAFGVYIYDDSSASADIYQWIFNGNWSSVDNTKQGVVFRILFMFKHGVPVGDSKSGVWEYYAETVFDNKF